MEIREILDTVSLLPHAGNLSVLMHCAPLSGRILIVMPGRNSESMHGYNNKYLTLSRHLSSQGITACVQMPNNPYPDPEYGSAIVADLQSVVAHAIRNRMQLSGTLEPQICLMGFSAGASACAVVARSNRLIQKILLCAPSGNAGMETIRRNLGSFTGEVYILQGMCDTVVGSDAGKEFYDMSTSASKRELVELPDCDHQFRGRINGMIVSKAPAWALVGDDTFPSPKDGIELY